MVKWIIKFVVVFSVIQLEYVSTDIRKVYEKYYLPYDLNFRYKRQSIQYKRYLNATNFFHNYKRLVKNHLSNEKFAQLQANKEIGSESAKLLLNHLNTTLERENNARTSKSSRTRSNKLLLLLGNQTDEHLLKAFKYNNSISLQLQPKSREIGRLQNNSSKKHTDKRSEADDRRSQIQTVRNKKISDANKKDLKHRSEKWFRHRSSSKERSINLKLKKSNFKSSQNLRKRYIEKTGNKDKQQFIENTFLQKRSVSNKESVDSKQLENKLLQKKLESNEESDSNQLENKLLQKKRVSKERSDAAIKNFKHKIKKKEKEILKKLKPKQGGQSYSKYKRIIKEKVKEPEKLLHQIEEKVKSNPDDSFDEELKLASKQTVEESTDPCVAKPCLNGGTCLRKEEKHPPFTCKCSLGYRGTLCDRLVPECENQPCNEGGHCVATEDGFLCVCKPGVTGKHCELEPQMKTLTSNATIIILTKEEVFDGEIGIGVFIVILVILAIHFYRVKRRRELMAKQYHEMLTKSDVPPPLPPGVIEVSNLLCNEFFCSCTKQSVAVETYVKASKIEKGEEPLKAARSSHKSLKKSSSIERKHSSHRNISASLVEKPKSRTSYVALRRQDSLNSLVSNDSQRLLPRVPSAQLSLQRTLSKQVSKKASSRKWPYEDPSSALSILPKRPSTGHNEDPSSPLSMQPKRSSTMPYEDPPPGLSMGHKRSSTMPYEDPPSGLSIRQKRSSIEPHVELQSALSLRQKRSSVDPYEDHPSALSMRLKKSSTSGRLSSTSLQHTDIPPATAFPPPPPPL